MIATSDHKLHHRVKEPARLWLCAFHKDCLLSNMRRERRQPAGYIITIDSIVHKLPAANRNAGLSRKDTKQTCEEKRLNRPVLGRFNEKV